MWCTCVGLCVEPLQVVAFTLRRSSRVGVCLRGCRGPEKGAHGWQSDTCSILASRITGSMWGEDQTVISYTILNQSVWNYKSQRRKLTSFSSHFCSAPTDVLPPLYWHSSIFTVPSAPCKHSSFCMLCLMSWCVENSKYYGRENIKMTTTSVVKLNYISQMHRSEIGG